MFKKILGTSLLCTQLSLSYSMMAHAEKSAPQAPSSTDYSFVQDTMDKSKNINAIFNLFFKKTLEQGATPRDDSKYLLSMPKVGELSTVDYGEKFTQCLTQVTNLLNSTTKGQSSLSGPRDFCTLQGLTTNLTSDDISPLSSNETSQNSNPVDSKNQNDWYKDAIQNLQDNDTLVVIVPGIFGEFIDQTAFGEVFEHPSVFSTQFDNYIQSTNANSLKNKNPEINNSHRFFLKNIFKEVSFMSHAGEKFNPSVLFEPITINKWMKVASIDLEVKPNERKPLVKVAVFGLEPMSLESLGKQSELAVLYSQRLNQFMQVYKKMNDGKLPSRVVLMGYSRGTPISYEMLTLLTSNDLRSYNQTLLAQAQALPDEDPTKSRKLNTYQSKLIIYDQAKEWSSHLVGQVSLGGVVLGTAIADENVVIRDTAPFKVKFVQSFKDLIFSLQIITQDDLDNAYKALKEAGAQSYKAIDSTNSLEVPTLNNKALLQIKPLTSKLVRNILAYNKFFTKLRIEIYSDYPNNDKDIKEKLKSVDATIGKLISSGSELMGQIEQDANLDYFTSFQKIADYTLEVKTFILNIKSLLENSSSYQPDIMGMQGFTNEMLENFGIVEIKARITEAIKNKDLYALLKGINHFTNYFKYYFTSAWNGISELSTDSRLTWLSTYGQFLPQNVKYYSIIGTLGQEGTSFYDEGVGFGYNKSSDQSFLNKSYNDLKSVGTNDGLGLAYKGTRINDSQVDWHKTVLWPQLAKSFTGKKFDTKILGVLRTHHWGLALPVAFKDKDILGNSVKNPFPRSELMQTIVMAITHDLSQSSK